MEQIRSLGFTGTREGMTPEQKDELLKLLDELSPAEFHHGACIGADETAAHFVSQELFPMCTVIAHPTRLGLTSYKALNSSDTIHPTLPPLDRNRMIVDDSEALIACPKSKDEELRSGTWATVRYARKRNKPVIVIYPDGTRGE